MALPSTLRMLIAILRVGGSRIADLYSQAPETAVRRVEEDLVMVAEGQ